MLELNNITHSYVDGDKSRKILDNLSYNFEKGKFYTIFGPSGSGKTTLLSLMAGLDGVQEGKILVDGKDIKDIGLMKYRRNYLSVIFQQFNLIRYLSAVDNVINVMETTENSVPKPYKKTALNLLKMLGIVESKAERSIFKLSGGEQQRVAIARGLATNVDLILADEPTGNLDTVTESEIIKVFQNLAKKYNKCVIVVSHSDYVSKHSDVHLDLVDGKLVGRDV